MFNIQVSKDGKAIGRLNGDGVVTDRNYAMHAAIWMYEESAQRDLERVKGDFLPEYELEVVEA